MLEKRRGGGVLVFVVGALVLENDTSICLVNEINPGLALGQLFQ
jgi:hypothetical protein